MGESTTIYCNHVLYIHPSDPANFKLATRLLNGDNYSHWKRCSEVTLAAQNKLEIVDGRFTKPLAGSTLLPYWERCNNLVISWLLHSIESEISESVIYCSTAQEIWEELEQRYGRANGPKIFQLQKELSGVTQGNQSVAIYFAKMKSLWDELSTVMKLPPCNCGSSQAIASFIQDQRLMQFLMGLNDEYKTVRGNILMILPLPSVSQTYNLILQEEKQREITSSAPLNVEASAMAAQSKRYSGNSWNNVGSQNVAGSQSAGNSMNSRFNQGASRNNPPRRESFFCTHCKIAGHTNDRCFKLHPELRNQRNRRFNPQAHMVDTQNKETVGDESVQNPPTITHDMYHQLIELLKKNNMEVADPEPSDYSAMLVGPFNEHASGPW